MGLMFLYLYFRKEQGFVKTMFGKILIFNTINFFLMIGMPYLLMIHRLDLKRDFEISLTIICIVFIGVVIRHISNYSKKP